VHTVQHEDAGVLRAGFTEPIDWQTAEEALETAAGALRRIRGDRAAMERLAAVVTSGASGPLLSAWGCHWLRIEDLDDGDTEAWLRFSPSGCVRQSHLHAVPFVALVLHGMYKQVLFGIGGGVASPDHEIPLSVRQERAGQVFALAAGQRHSSASGAECLLLVLKPRCAADAPDGDAGPGAAGSPAPVLAKLRRVLRTVVQGS
jgi:hypothetical protein